MIPATCKVIVERVSISDDGMGGQTESWSQLDEFQGHIRQLSAEEKEINERLSVKSSHRLYCGGHDIKEKDRILADGKTFNVVGVNAKINRRGQSRFLNVDMERLS